MYIYDINKILKAIFIPVSTFLFLLRLLLFVEQGSIAFTLARNQALECGHKNVKSVFHGRKRVVARLIGIGLVTFEEQGCAIERISIAPLHVFLVCCIYATLGALSYLIVQFFSRLSKHAPNVEQQSWIALLPIIVPPMAVFITFRKNLIRAKDPYGLRAELLSVMILVGIVFPICTMVLASSERLSDSNSSLRTFFRFLSALLLLIQIPLASISPFVMQFLFKRRVARLCPKIADLEATIRNIFLWEQLKQQIIADFCPEVVFFIEDYTLIENRSDAWLASRLAASYVKNNAVYELNIPYSVKKIVLDKLADESLSLVDFEPVYNEVLESLCQNSFARFLAKQKSMLNPL